MAAGRALTASSRAWAAVRAFSTDSHLLAQHPCNPSLFVKWREGDFNLILLKIKPDMNAPLDL